MRSQSIAVREHRRAAADACRGPRRRAPRRLEARARRPARFASPIFSNFWPLPKPGDAAIDEECRDAAVKALVGIGDREHDRDVGHGPVGDERLGAVDSPAVADALGARAHRERVGARIGLGDRVRADQRAVAKARQIAALLLVAAVLPDRHDAGEQVRAKREHEAAVAAAVAKRLERDRARQRVEAACRRIPRARAGPECRSSRTAAKARARTSARGRAR